MGHRATPGPAAPYSCGPARQACGTGALASAKPKTAKGLASPTITAPSRPVHRSDRERSRARPEVDPARNRPAAVDQHRRPAFLDHRRVALPHLQDKGQAGELLRLWLYPGENSYV
jgi:hypothetical protein